MKLLSAEHTSTYVYAPSTTHLFLSLFSDFSFLAFGNCLANSFHAMQFECKMECKIKYIRFRLVDGGCSHRYRFSTTENNKHTGRIVASVGSFVCSLVRSYVRMWWQQLDYCQTVRCTVSIRPVDANGHQPLFAPHLNCHSDGAQFAFSHVCALLRNVKWFSYVFTSLRQSSFHNTHSDRLII